MNSIRKISPNNEALKFLAHRIEDVSYRGIHTTQHTRYELDRVEILLKLLDEYAPNQSLIKIRTQDLSRRPYALPAEASYVSLCEDYKKKTGTGTQDTIRKNLAVDFHRMGLIKRYDENKNVIDPFSRGTVHYFSITDLGLKLIRSDKISEKSFIFCRAISNVMGNVIDILLNILMDPNFNFRKITLNEYMFFVSAVDNENEFSFGKSIEEVKELIKSYRYLSSAEQRQISLKLSTLLNPENFTGNKTNLRDYHNWKNEAQDVFYKLNPTPYFEYNRSEGFLNLRAEKGDVLESKRLKRSTEEKLRYFKEHKIDKKDGFELHHIVPLSWSESKEHFVTLDKYQNMVYIDGYKHGIISQNKNKYVQLNFVENDNVELSDSFDEKIQLHKDINIIYSIDKKDTMSSYNKKLLSGSAI